ncbi:CHAT domain-containing protein [Streptomyces sp. NPDC057950]|uniref:CHAT domain-containing protein n=1 Tax=Streptomyces sp. NPDC057950 TaxID=3346288 RepID=UPI0036E3852A
MDVVQRDRLLGAVREAIAEHRGTGSVAALLALEGDGTVTRLVLAMDDTRVPDLAALHAVGLARWLQYAAGPEDAHEAEWEASLYPLASVYASEPDAVPPRAAALLEAVRSGRRREIPRLSRATRGRVLAGLRSPVALSARFADAVRGLDPQGRRPYEDAAALRAFVPLTPRHHPDRVAAVQLLVVCLQMAYRSNGEPGTLAEAVRWGRELLLLIPAAGDRWAHAVSNQARVLADQFRHSGDREDIDEAVAGMREALRHAAPDSEWLADWHYESAVYLSSRYAAAGDLADLNAAVDACRTAVRATLPGAPQGADRRSRLAGLLRKRYSGTGDGAALDEAVQIVRTEPRPLPEYSYGSVVAEHADVLEAEFLRNGRLSVRDEALALYREAVAVREAAGGDPADLPTALTHLGNMLLTGADPGGEHGPADAEPLREAVAAHRRAIAVNRADDPGRSGFLNNLARCLRELARIEGRSAALDEAVDLLREAVAITGRTQAVRSTLLSHLSLALVERHRAAGGPGLLQEAYVLAREAADVAVGTPGQLIFLHRSSAERAAAVGRWDEAAQAYARAIALLPQAVPRQLHGSESQRQLARHGDGLAADAAATVLQAGGPGAAGRALEQLEQGRGILLPRSVGLRGEEEALREAAPQLAARLAALRDALTRPASSGVDPGDDRHRLAEEWDAVVELARRLPGLEDFLRPPRLAFLRRAAAGGPVVTVNTSALRCDALVLTGHGVTAVPLPALTHEEAASRAAAFSAALRVAESPASSLTTRLTAQSTLAQTLDWLWATALGPALAAAFPPAVGSRPSAVAPQRPSAGAGSGTPTVVAQAPPLGALSAGGRAGEAPQERLPRIWLSATGPLAGLPLHAAGGESGSVLDRAVPSHTPTVAALAAVAGGTAGRAEARMQGGAALVVALPETPGFAPLDGALDEARVATERYGPGTLLLTGPQATRVRLLAELPGRARVHFACHAIADPTGPHGSHLILHDQPVTVAEISRLRLAHGEFCYLSACATAGGTLPDEAVHPGGAFHLAGFAEVVATLWPVEDSTAAEAARLFHTGDRHCPARALHAAVLRLRADAPLLPSRWASHIHIGR